jgi:hypothetical protein
MPLPTLFVDIHATLAGTGVEAVVLRFCTLSRHSTTVDVGVCVVDSSSRATAGSGPRALAEVVRFVEALDGLPVELTAGD